MKKIAIIVLLGMIFTSLNAQNGKVRNLRYLDSQPVHFGFTVGFNYMDFTIHKSEQFWKDTSNFYSIENKALPGFHLGPIANFRMGMFFDLRVLVNLSFGQRNLSYLQVDQEVEDGSGYITEAYIMKIGTTNIEVPILLKYKAARYNNFRPYVILGACPKYDLSAKKMPTEAEMPKVQLNTFDFCADMGVGIDFYLPYFKLSTELKYSKGFTNILKNDGTAYTTAIDKMTSNMFMFSLHFEGGRGVK